MTTLFDPNKPVPKEVLEQMVGLSTKEDQRKDLDKQLALSHSLANLALTPRDMTGQRRTGGLINAAGQGLTGYLAGKRILEDQEMRAKLLAESKEARLKYSGLAGAPMPDPNAAPGGMPLPEIPQAQLGYN